MPVRLPKQSVPINPTAAVRMTTDDADCTQPPISGTERLRRILAASRFGISECRGTASTAPVFGLHQRECELPSRLS